jgi:hypothetical protein
VRGLRDGIFDVVLTIWVLAGPNLCGEGRFYQGMLIQRQSYHGDYACSLNRVAMSDDDGIDSSTQVPTARHAWAPVATSYHARH